MEKTVLVTGANGMLATNIMEKLALAGYKVIGTVRKGRSYRGEGRENVTVVEADFKDETAMKPLVSKCDVVFHVAAMTSQSETDYEKFRKVNVESTRMLLDLSVASGVGAFVYVSTANTIGYGAAEGAEMKYPFSKSLYALSKKEAETVALSYQDKLRVVVVNPTFMIGKYGTEKGSNRIFSMVRKSKAVFCPSGGKNVLDVEEAARGMILAMEKAASGSQYLITGTNYHYREMFGRMAENFGVKRIFVKLPDWILKAAGWFGDLMAKCGIVTEVSTLNMDMLMTENFYRTDKAFREIGFKARDIFDR